MEQAEAVSGTPGAGVDGGERKAATALKVVVAVDASDESLHALSWALDNIVRCHPDAGTRRSSSSTPSTPSTTSPTPSPRTVSVPVPPDPTTLAPSQANT